MSSSRLTLERVIAVSATVGIADQAAAFGIYGEVIKVEEIATACAQGTLQTDSAGLNGIIWRRVDRNPIGASIVSCSDVEVPDVSAVQCGTIWVACARSARSEDAGARSKKTESWSIVVSGDHDRKYRVSDPKWTANTDSS